MNRRATGVDEVIINEELVRRSSRPPDFEAESRALVALAEVMAESPMAILQKLVDTAMELCQADSAGISIEETDGGKEVFRWQATAGAYTKYQGGTMPRAFSPCGTVLDRNSALLMADPVRFYPYIDALSHPVVEVLLIPFYRRDVPIGTIWAVAHTPSKQFEAEDARLLKSLSRFASAAVRTLRNLESIKTADRELHDARLRLDSALEAGSIATWTWDLLTNRVIADRNLARLFLVAPKDAEGGTMASYLNAVHPQDRARVETIFGEAVQSGTGFEVEYRIVQEDGACRWIVARARPELDDMKRPPSLVGAFVDITDQKRSEESVARSEERFRALVTASPDVVYRMSADWSELRHLVGRGFIDDTHAPTRAWLEKYLDPEDRQYVLDAAEHAVRTRSIFELEHRVRRRDGSLGWTFSRAVPILDQDGCVVEWFGTATDVTRRKEEEAKRRQLEQENDRQRRLYEAAISNTPDLVYIFDLNHRFLYANEALLRMWGRSREQALGKTCLELGYPTWHAAMHDCEIDQVVATRRPIRGEVPFEGTNGRRIYDYIFVPVVGEGGEVVAVAGTTRDVTERQRNEQAIREQADRLQENDRRKDEFLAMLAHELRNPLSAIGNAVNVASRSGREEHMSWAIEVIGRQARHLTHLIDDLLDISRIRLGKIVLRQSVLDLTSVVESSLATTGPLIESRGHTLNVTIDPGGLWCNVDPTRMEQVLVNLLTNAAKYSENHGRIQFFARNEGEEVVVSVKDQGHGIPPEKLPQMFELFTQGDRSLARTEGGLGIGLTVVKKLVEMHGGEITATSDGPNLGSEFIVRLPRVRVPIAAPRDQEPCPRSPMKKTRILILDDNADTACGMAKSLELLGHDVVVTHNGLEGIERARDHHPEVILLDIGLPGMDGFEVATRLRREPSCKDAVIIAVSGYGRDHDRQRSREAGIDHHLIKPLDHNILLTLLSLRNHDPR